MPSSTPRATFVVNAHAAGGRTGKRWAACEPKMRAAFPTGEIQFTQGVGDGARIAQEAVSRGQELIVAVGGDGTVFEVVNGMMAADAGARTRVRLGIWPAGSGADFARGAHLPNDPEAVCALITKNEPKWVDVGRVQCVDSDGRPVERYFINAADFGIGAKVVERLQKRSRLLPGRSSYLWQSLRTLVTFKNPKVDLDADGRVQKGATIITMVVANGRYFGGGMCIAPAAILDDGLLNTIQVGGLGRIEAMRKLQETFGGQPIDHPDVDYSTCKILRAQSTSRVPIEADGELVGFLPASFEIIPRALQLLLP